MGRREGERESERAGSPAPRTALEILLLILAFAPAVSHPSPLSPISCPPQLLLLPPERCISRSPPPQPPRPDPLALFPIRGSSRRATTRDVLRTRGDDRPATRARGEKRYARVKKRGGREEGGAGEARYVSEKLEENGKFIAAALSHAARMVLSPAPPPRAVKDDAC